ncbi:hypothetical protein H8R20_10355 [Morganella morganii]|uniref:hypothetical protein n=1 Tax=Morganella morganii TaxID=582 RepID=UPI0016457033|nr:hypothetical protein [Morganella morganii]MBC3995985.1 hypothetical protein [Morganella morganii]MBT0385031.1 hypothetical protein [Morganella morganii subsp. morganii]
MAYCNDFDPMDQFYCRDGEIADISEEAKERVYFIRRIMRILRNTGEGTIEELIKFVKTKPDDNCKPYTGLDESIYYQCADSEPSVETAMNRTELLRDITVTTYYGTKRALYTIAYFSPGSMSFVSRKRLSGGYQIMKENAEAVYLLRFLVDPYKNFEEAIDIIVSAVLENIPSSRRKKLNDFIATNIKYIGVNPIDWKAREITDRYVDTIVAHHIPSFIGNSVLRKYIVTAISAGVIASVAYRYPSLFSIKNLIIRRAVVIATLLYTYGTIEEMAMAAKRLKERNYAVYQVLDRAQLSLIYYFLEEELKMFVELAAKPEGTSADDAFVQEVRSLIARYRQ